MKGNAEPRLNSVKKTYLKLIKYLINKQSIPEKFKMQVYDARKIEADIIKRSILGSQKFGYKGKGCLECHAPPSNFPRGNITNKKTRSISRKERKAEELYNAVSDEYTLNVSMKEKKKIDGWVEELGADATYNFSSYADCFVSENLIRKYIQDNSIKLSPEAEGQAVNHLF